MSLDRRLKRLEGSAKPGNAVLHAHLVVYFLAFYAGDQAEVDRLSVLPEGFPSPTTNDHIQAIRDAKDTLKGRGE